MCERVFVSVSANVFVCVFVRTCLCFLLLRPKPAICLEMCTVKTDYINPVITVYLINVGLGILGEAAKGSFSNFNVGC